MKTPQQAKVSVCLFENGVYNSTDFKRISWDALFQLLQKPYQTIKSPLKSPAWKKEKESCGYFIRGLVKEKRTDSNLGKCFLLNIDGDSPIGSKMPSVKKVHKAMRGLAHIVYTTSTPGRWRLVVPVRAHPKESVSELTEQLYHHILSMGVKVEFAGESKTKSQPMFLGQNTKGHKYEALGHRSSLMWEPQPTEYRRDEKKLVGSKNNLLTFIKELESGTIHQSAKTYAGWLKLTTNLSLTQIFDDITALIEHHCTDQIKIDRWNKKERNKMEGWFASQDFSRIHFDAETGAPSLPYETMFPPKSNFKKIAKSILFHQSGVYNPDMAFWFTLILIDYLAGCGYESVLSSDTAPLYVFTAGNTSDGKTVTIKSGEKHLHAIDGRGINFIEEHDEEEDAPVVASEFRNKKIFDDIGSAEGIKDQIHKMGHGADLLFVQDEYGLSDKGTVDSSGKAMRKLLLGYKTLGRAQAIQPRLLASNKDNQKKEPRYCVHFNYFTAATTETLKGVIKDSEVGQGYVQRFIGGISRGSKFCARITKFGSMDPPKKVDKEIIKILKHISNKAASVMGYERTINGYPVKITKRANKLIRKYSIRYIEGTDTSYSKVMENVFPVARVRAIAENPQCPVVTKEYVEWAHEVVICSIDYFKWLIKELKRVPIEPTSQDSMADRLLAKMIEKGFVGAKKKATKAQIMSSCGFKNYPASLKNAVWKSLLESETIIKTENKTISGQTTLKYFVSHKTAKL